MLPLRFSLSVLFITEGFFACMSFNTLKERTNVNKGHNDHHHNQGRKPISLSPLLERGQIQEAQRLAKVNLTFSSSYSGYFTVNEGCDSNLFFWFFEAQHDWRNAPILVWLQGGPGASSMYGLFEEVGPILYNETLQSRNISWNIKNNLIFIDQPVGTGYSFSGKGCYSTSSKTVTEDLYSAIVQFYILFPELKRNKLFMVGQSYAGHFIPDLCQAIHQRNPTAKEKINLAGMMIGNGLMDLRSQGDYSDYLYNLGLIDEHQRSSFNWTDLGNQYMQVVGNVDAYNYLKDKENPTDTFPWEKFITSPQFRKYIHVGDQPFMLRNFQVHESLREDYSRSLRPQLEELLEHYPMVFYHGQLDIVCAYPMAVKFLQSLSWSGQSLYRNASRHQWCVGNHLAGYYRSSHNLHDVLVRGAGHKVPEDQPLAAYILMDTFTSGPLGNPLRDLSKCFK